MDKLKRSFSVFQRENIAFQKFLTEQLSPRLEFRGKPSSPDIAAGYADFNRYKVTCLNCCSFGR